MSDELKTEKLVEELKNKNYTLLGSRYFFTGIEGFKPHDYDFCKIVDKIKLEGKKYIRTHIDGVCIFNIQKMDFEEFIKIARIPDNRFMVCSLFNPEICKELGFDFFKIYKDLLPLLKRLPNKYSYYIIICNSYLKNGKMKLTNEQRQQAYLQYLKYRQ